MLKNSLILWITIGFSGLAISRKLPDYVRVCSVAHPNLSKCWRESLEAIIPYLTQDRPELNLLSIDPFRIPEFKLEHNTPASNFYLNIVVNDVDFIGLSGIQVLDLAADLKDYSLAINAIFPHTSAIGKYKCHGKMVGIEFAGNGKTYEEFTNVTINMTWTGRPYTKRGKEYLRVEVKYIDMKIGKTYIHLDNLFRENSILNENFNKILNENSQILLKEFEPFLKRSLSEMLVQYINRFYGEFPLDVLHPRN